MTAPAPVSQTMISRVGALFHARQYGRTDVLAVFVLGLACAQTVTLHTAAEAVVAQGRTAKATSVEKQFRRWLRNPRVDPESLWAEMTPTLLADWAGSELTLVLDATPHGAAWSILVIGVVSSDRVLPLAGIVKPQQTTWDETTVAAIRPACTRIAASLPPGSSVTLLADQGLVGPRLIDLCQELGWHYTLRYNASAAPKTRVRMPDGRDRPLDELIPHPPRRSAQLTVVAGAIYRSAGWRSGWLTIYWGNGYTEPWVLLSDLPGGMARVRAYAHRHQIEATFQDLKTRGWQLETSHLRQADRLERLLLALFLTYWWMHALGRRVVRSGLRRRFDRAARRAVAVVKLGYAYCTQQLAHHHLPGWARATPAGWRFATYRPKSTPSQQSVR